MLRRACYSSSALTFVFFCIFRVNALYFIIGAYIFIIILVIISTNLLAMRMKMKSWASIIFIFYLIFMDYSWHRNCVFGYTNILIDYSIVNIFRLLTFTSLSLFSVGHELHIYIMTLCWLPRVADTDTFTIFVAERGRLSRPKIVGFNLLHWHRIMMQLLMTNLLQSLLH